MHFKKGEKAIGLNTPLNPDFKTISLYFCTNFWIQFSLVSFYFWIFWF